MSSSLFFDLDGTLTDPREGITRCIQYALENLSVEPVPSADELLWCIGPPLQQSFRRLVGEELAPRAVDLYRERFSEVGLFENQLYPSDAVGAIGNRIRFVGVLYGYGDRNELATAGAVEMVGSPDELTSLFIHWKSQ